MLVRNLFYFIFFMTFFTGLLINAGMPSQFTIFIEFTVILLLLLSLKLRAGKGVPVPIFLNVFLAYILISFFSVVLNDVTLLRAIESLRLIFRFYFFYLAIYWLEPGDALLKKVNLFLIILMLLQFPVIGARFLTFGINEETMGAWMRGGHVTAVLWPVCIFYCAAYYYLYKKSIYYIIFGVACIVATIVGAKRVVLFIYPVQIVAIYYYIYSKVSGKTFSKKVLLFSTLTVLITAVSGSIIYFNPSLNPDKKVGGEIDLKYSLEYTQWYLEAETTRGYSFGRLSTTRRVFRILYDSGISHVFFGVGPGVTTPPTFGGKKTQAMFEELYDEFKILYGKTPLTRIALEYGLIGVLPFAWMVFYLFRISWRLYLCETDPYWKAFAAGSVGFAFYTIFLFFGYAHAVFWAYTIPPLYYYAMAVVSIRYKQYLGAKTKQYDRGLVEFRQERLQGD